MNQIDSKYAILFPVVGEIDPISFEIQVYETQQFDFPPPPPPHFLDQRPEFGDFPPPPPAPHHMD